MQCFRAPARRLQLTPSSQPFIDRVGHGRSRSIRRIAISNGEESVFRSTALLLSWFISADY